MSDTKIKVLKAPTLEDLELITNAWITENPSVGVKIVNVLQSYHTSPNRDGLMAPGYASVLKITKNQS